MTTEDALLLIAALKMPIMVLVPMIPAVAFFKWLPTTKAFAKGDFQGLQINLSGAFAGYFLLLLLLVKTDWGQPTFAPAETKRAEVWEVEGAFADVVGEDVEVKVTLKPEPHDVDNSRFWLAFARMPRGPIGELRFPTLIFEARGRDWVSDKQVVNLESWIEQARASKDDDRRMIKLIGPVNFTRRATALPPYRPTGPALVAADAQK